MGHHPIEQQEEPLLTQTAHDWQRTNPPSNEYRREYWFTVGAIILPAVVFTIIVLRRALMTLLGLDDGDWITGTAYLVFFFCGIALFLLGVSLLATRPDEEGDRW